MNNNCILIEIIELIDYRLSARLTLSLSQPLTSNELNVELLPHPCLAQTLPDGSKCHHCHSHWQQSGKCPTFRDKIVTLSYLLKVFFFIPMILCDHLRTTTALSSMTWGQIV